MQLTCPNCAEPVPAEHINIQQMAAVCPACATIFAFDSPAAAKAKRRKVKQPARITVSEREGQTHIAFRTNFRLDQDQALIGGVTGSVMFLLTALVTAAGAFTGEESVLISLVFALLTVISVYWLALKLFNKTIITVDDDTVQITRRPLPAPWLHPTEINLTGVERIAYEETPISRREGYDTPRYNVWAQMIDGTRKPIVSDVIDDYAVFIAQHLNEYLEPDAGFDHLTDEAPLMTDDDMLTDDNQHTARR